jgi:hypothetical protein
MSPFLAFRIVLLSALALSIAAINFTDNDSASVDGCRYVYLDVGANMGMHVRFLYEAENYPKNEYGKEMFDRFFMKNRHRSDICAFGFEPNAVHVPRLDKLTTYLKKKGMNAAFFHGAVSNVTSTATFYGNEADLNSGVGFSGVALAGNNAKFTVNTIDLSAFILDKVVKRKIPPALFPNDPPPTILMKMDIEGYEHIVLPMMLATKALCELDVMTIEYHEKRIKTVPRGSDDKIKEQLISAQKKGCKVKIYVFDDETYHLDTEQGLKALEELMDD